MKRQRVLLVAAVVLLALAVAWFVQRRAMEAPTSAPRSATAATDAAGRSRVDLDPDWARRLDLSVEPAREESVAPVVRAAATVVPDESRVFHVHARVAGWVERVHVQTGQQVQRGQPLLSVFSQELHAAQREYLAVHANRGGALTSAVLPSSRARLRVLGMSNAQIAALESSRQPPSALTITAPHAGVVLRRSVAPGTAVDASTELLILADLSSIWVEAELAERDALLARPGAAVRIQWAAAGTEPVDARLDFVSPVLSERSRSVRVRVRLANPLGIYRPGLSGTLALYGEARRRITVARDAVVDTGQEQFVYVAQRDGAFLPRRVTLGPSSGNRVSVVSGLRAGEPVLVSGVFLVDSESRLRASGVPTHGGHGGAGAQARDRPVDRAAPAEDEHAGHSP